MERETEKKIQNCRAMIVGLYRILKNIMEGMSKRKRKQEGGGRQAKDEMAEYTGVGALRIAAGILYVQGGDKWKTNLKRNYIWKKTSKWRNY